MAYLPEIQRYYLKGSEISQWNFFPNTDNFLHKKRRKKTIKYQRYDCMISVSLAGGICARLPPGVLPGKSTSWRVILAPSGGRNEFHISCLCNSSLSSEWTNSYTLWWTMSDWKKNSPRTAAMSIQGRLWVTIWILLENRKCLRRRALIELHHCIDSRNNYSSKFQAPLWRGGSHLVTFYWRIIDQ